MCSQLSGDAVYRVGVVVRREVGDLAAGAGHKLVRVRAGVASDPGATAEVLGVLGRDASRTVRRVVAARVDAPPDVLRVLAGDPDRATREAVANNSGADPDVLILLLRDQHWSVRWSVVGNPAADLRVQEAMCASDDPDLRFVLAQSDGLPATIAAVLARDPAWSVREGLATNTDDQATLRILLDDPDPRMRAGAAMNAGTTAEQRRKLVHDPAWNVRASAVQSISAYAWDFPADDLFRLARDRSVNVRFWLANLPGSIRPVYELLARDPDDLVASAAGQWLLPPGYPGYPGNRPGEVLAELADLIDPGDPANGHGPSDLGGLVVQRRFANPAQLGYPIPEVRGDVLRAVMDRLGDPI